MGVLARTIAVIDDDARVLESLQNLLASSGYKAETYSSAELFLTSGALSRASCIITDVEMRRMSGLGLLQHVRSRQFDVPVIIVTGTSENLETFYLDRGANGFFRKPLDGDALLTLINNLCCDAS
jgi:FixJ family two-component response regulator